MFADVDKLDQVLRNRRVKFTAEDLINDYAAFETKWKKSFASQLGLPELTELAQVYKFKHSTVSQCALEITNWLRQHQELYHDDYRIVIDKIRARLRRFEDEDGMQVPKINFAPHYGGTLQNKKNVPKEELEWLQENGNQYWLTGEAVRQENSD